MVLNTGVSGTGGASDAEVGENVPQTKATGNIGWSIRTFAASGHAWIPDGSSDLKFFLGRANSSEWTYESWITPEEAWGIDKKIDDGQPMTGMLMARHNNDCTLAANSADSGADYKLDDSDTDCALIFNMD